MGRTWPLVLALLVAPCAAQSPDGLEGLIARGDLEAAEAMARAWGDSGRVAVGEILVLRGQLAEAAAWFTSVRDENGRDRRRATVALAELAARRGDHDAAIRLAREVVDGWNARADWSAPDHVAAGRAFRLLGQHDPSEVRSALAAFDAATAADPNSIEGRLGAADLFLERYNAPDARIGYNEVLERRAGEPRALVGLARATAFSSEGDPQPLIARALAANPRFVPALLLKAQLLLEAEQYDSARIVTEAALAADSSSSEAWAALGALAWMAGDSAALRRAEEAATALNPQPAGFFTQIAEAAGRQRRYAEAVELARRAVALDTTSVPALGALGTNLLRTGFIAEGKAVIDRAFARDPYHLWHKNTLDLVEQLEEFTTISTARFSIVAPEQSAALLAAVLGPLLEEAYDSLANRYQYRPPTPIRFELYDRHADFSVRTVGLVGLGALGVSFGNVLVMDAPQARGPAEFNLGSTAWHELAHTFTLGVSRNRVPRWVSEGLSVLEERRARAGWGARANVPFVQALSLDQLLPISRLNDGFVRPDRPDRLGLSYYQASLVMEFLEERSGIEGIRRLLRAYGAGKGSDAALQEVTGVTVDALDAEFERWVRARFAAPLRALAAGEVGVINGALEQANDALARADTAAAVRAFRTARDRFPELGASNGAGLPLAITLWRQGDRRAALAEVAVVTGGDETALDANLLEAEWRLEAGDTTGALEALERATWIAANDSEVWARRAEVAALAGRFDDLVLARHALVQLRPSDPVAARTDLAEAMLQAGDASGARRELLGVLERAPGYERAQMLLLRARTP